MRRFGWLVGVAILAVVGGGGRAQGSPLTLAFSGGGGLGLQIRTDNPATTIDVANGFSKFAQEGYQTIIAGTSADGMHESINTSFGVTATLSDADRLLATVQFSGPITGEESAGPWTRDYQGGAHGSSVGVVTIAPEVDPNLIPTWLGGMSAVVDSYVTGGTSPFFWTTLTITAANPAQVPEPSSALVFLAAAGLIGVRRLRRA